MRVCVGGRFGQSRQQSIDECSQCECEHLVLGRKMMLHCADRDTRPFCDLANAGIFQSGFRGDIEQCRRKQAWTRGGFSAFRHTATWIGRASCRERVWSDVSISVVAVPLQKKTKK